MGAVKTWWGERSYIWLRGARLAGAVVFGVLLVAVPSIFSLFPGLAQIPRRDRGWILAVWLGVALLAVATAALTDDELHQIVEAEREEAAAAEHRTVIRDRFTSILSAGVGGIPGSYMVSIHAPSADGQFLVPIHPRALGLTDPAFFATGSGAVGSVWTGGNDAIVVKGEALSSDQHGLTPLQQRSYAEFQVVAAVLIRGSDDTPLGVLSVISKTDDGFFGTDETGVEALRRVAAGIAWLLPEAVEWMLLSADEVSE